MIPVPVIKVTPTKALAADGFKVSYRTGDSKCLWEEAQVFWDGKPVGPRIRSSRRPAAPSPRSIRHHGWRGRHNVSVQACNTETAAPAPRRGPGSPSSRSPLRHPPRRRSRPRSPRRPRLRRRRRRPRRPDARADSTPTPVPTASPSGGSSRPRARPSRRRRRPRSSSSPPRPRAATRSCPPSPASSRPRPIDPAVVGTNLLLTLSSSSCSG